MNIEILFKELYIYGEDANADYLELMFKNQNIINTSYEDKPFFVDNIPDLIFIGAISEYYLDKIADKLYPYKDRLKELIESGVHLIVMNNSMDIFGKSLEIQGFDKDYHGQCLGLLNYKAIRNYDKRYARLAIAKLNNIEIIGHNMGFSQYYYENESDHLYEMVAGFGFNNKSKIGGFRYKNVFCTELVSELFITNPLISKALLKRFNLSQDLPYEKYVFDIYNYRIKHMKNDSVVTAPIDYDK